MWIPGDRRPSCYKCLKSVSKHQVSQLQPVERWVLLFLLLTEPHSTDLIEKLGLYITEANLLGGERTHRDGQSGKRKRERSDRGQKHCEAKRRFESHVSEGDVAALRDRMAAALRQVFREVKLKAVRTCWAQNCSMTCSLAQDWVGESAGGWRRNHLGNCKRVCVGRSSKLEIRRGFLLAQECN